MSEYLDCYIRVSTDEQRTEGNSLSVQEDMGRKLSKRLGLKFRLRNEGSRSSTRHYREVLEELKEDIQKGHVKNVWSQDRSRLFRTLEHSLVFRNEYLERHGVKLFEGSSTQEVRLDSPMEKGMYNMISVYQEMENETRREKSRRGKIHKVKTQSHVKPIFLGGTVLFGYKNVEKEWVVDKEESKLVKNMFNWYESGKTLKEIQNEFNKSGFSSRRSKLWSLGTIQRMLKNSSYTGLHTIKFKSKQYTKEKPHYDYIDSYKIPKIINVGQFNRVQKKLGLNHKNKDNNKKHFSLLDDILICECGTRFGSVNKMKTLKDRKIFTRKYYCQSNERQWKDDKNRNCGTKFSLDMDKTNDMIVKLVKETVRDSNLLKETYKKQVLETKGKSDKEIEKKTKKIEDSLQRIQYNIDNFENQIVELEIEKSTGDRSKSLIDKMIKRYSEELESNHERYKLLEKDLENLDEDRVWVDWLGKFGKDLNLNTKNEQKTRQWLLGLVDKIVVKGQYEYDERKKKETMIGHSFKIYFKMNIVGDNLVYLDESKKSKGYNVEEGKRIKNTGLLLDLGLQRGRRWVKKK